MQDDEGNVREMTRTERKFFKGVTIEAGTDDGRSENFYSQRSYDTPRRTYASSNIFARIVDSFLLALLRGNRLAKVAMILIGIAFAALMFFVAIPVLFILLAIGLALLALAKISR